jgi:hypothetical protein
MLPCETPAPPSPGGDVEGGPGGGADGGGDEEGVTPPPEACVTPPEPTDGPLGLEPAVDTPPLTGFPPELVLPPAVAGWGRAGRLG